MAEAKKKELEAEEKEQELEPTEEEWETFEGEVADLRAKAARRDFDTDELRDLAAELGEDEGGCVLWSGARRDADATIRLRPRKFHKGIVKI